MQAREAGHGGRNIDVAKSVPNNKDLNPALGGINQSLFEQVPDFVIFPNESLKENVRLRRTDGLQHRRVYLNPGGVDLHFVLGKGDFRQLGYRERLDGGLAPGSQGIDDDRNRPGDELKQQEPTENSRQHPGQLLRGLHRQFRKPGKETGDSAEYLAARLRTVTTVHSVLQFSRSFAHLCIPFLFTV